MTTAQLPTRAELRLEHVSYLRWHPENGDKRTDGPPPVRRVPPDAPVYRFGNGRFTFWENFWQVGEGRYTFGGPPGRPTLEVRWEKSPLGRQAVAQHRVLIRFGDGEMAWCHDLDRPDRAPDRFAAETGDAIIFTFRKVE